MRNKIRNSIATAGFTAAAFMISSANAQEPVEGEVLLPKASTWEYLLYAPDDGNGTFTPVDPSIGDPDFYDTWHMAAGYNGPAFSSGAAPLGYEGDGTNDFLKATDIWANRNGTVQPTIREAVSYYFTTFTPSAEISDLRFKGLLDDGAIFYINGTEVERANVDDGVNDTWNLLTTATGTENADTNYGDINFAALGMPNLAAGVAVSLGISVHNANGTSSDMGMDISVIELIPPDPSAPDNDNFGFAQLVSNAGLPVTATGRTHDGSGGLGLGATLEADEPQHAAGGANVGSVWYSFNPLEDARLQISAGASDFDAVLGVYTGIDVNALTQVATSDGDVRFYPGATVFFDASSAETYFIAVSGQDNGGAPAFGDNYGNVSVTIQEAPGDSLFTPDIAQPLLPAGSDWFYLLAAEANQDDPPLPNQPVDPALFGAGDPDFHTTWQTATGYNGPAFQGPAPALLGYGAINGDPILTDIWGARDIDNNPNTDDLEPPAGARYTAYFRTSFTTPAGGVQHLGFRGLVDDGAAIYIDGAHVSNINFAGDPADWQALALGIGTEDGPQEGIAANVNLPGNTSVEIAVALFNSGDASSDIGFDIEVYSIEQPTIDFGLDLAALGLLKASFETAAPGDTSGLGNGGSEDNLPWIDNGAGTVLDELTEENPPFSQAQAVWVNNGAINFVSGNIDIRGVDNSLVATSFQFRTSAMDTESEFETNDTVVATIEGSSDGITFTPIATFVDIAGDSDPDVDGDLEVLILPDGEFTTFTSPSGVPADIQSIRIVVNAVNNSGSENFFLNDVIVGTDIGPPPPFYMDISRNNVTGQNTLTWETDGESRYEVYFGDLSDWGFIGFLDPGQPGILVHTPAVDDTEGFYQVRRFAGDD